MSKLDPVMRPELCAASDEVIEDAVKYTDPMVLRGLLYQLTGDAELVEIDVEQKMVGFYRTSSPVRQEDVALLQRKAADFLKAYRDAGAGAIDIGPRERLPDSLRLIAGENIPQHQIGVHLEELALDPDARSLQWTAEPDPERLKAFTVTVIGCGMGGLNAALQLKRAGIPFTVIEKNGGVGGTWHENRYPGARVDTPSRGYTHIFGVDFGYPNPFCEWRENQKYFDWVADAHDLRKDIVFNTEVRSMTWDEKAGQWEILVQGPQGERVIRSNAVITAVGFLNRPRTPDFEGQDAFEGPSWHTSRWPQGMDLRGKRVAVVGTGCTGYQLIPELALDAGQVTVFMRTPQWVFPVEGYRSPFPPQTSWLDRNLPFHTNAMRFRSTYGSWFTEATEYAPGFDDPDACSPMNKQTRDAAIAFLKRKIDDPALVARLIPKHPAWSARPVMVDPQYSFFDAVQRDNVSLVTSGVKRINRTGIEDADGRQHDVDAIVYAIGFHATEYLFPMTITGRGGQTVEQTWADGGARAYLTCMIPGFPNLWSIYGPNTNGGLQVASFCEMVTIYALQCIERLILEGKQSVDAKQEAYWSYNHEVDARNARRVWSDPRARNYYWTKFGRSAVQNPFTASEMWDFLRRPDFTALEVR